MWGAFLGGVLIGGFLFGLLGWGLGIVMGALITNQNGSIQEGLEKLGSKVKIGESLHFSCMVSRDSEKDDDGGEDEVATPPPYQYRSNN